jgi:hypothetical protein
MLDDSATSSRHQVRASLRPAATVTELASRRPEENVLDSITLVFGGVNYGTISVRAPYAEGRPIVLYIVPAHGSATDDALHGPIDCLITDDPGLALGEAQ